MITKIKINRRGVFRVRERRKSKSKKSSTSRSRRPESLAADDANKADKD